MITKGQVFEHQYRVNEDVYQGFIDLFGDRNPLHTNESFAREKGFNSVVMHGNILNGFLSHFIGECLPQKNVVIQTQEIQYSKPVYLNDILMLHVQVIDVFESVRAVELKYYFENQNKLKVAKGKVQIGQI